ncbi:uncharacterized protein LOC111401904 isoform X2 [Olea europaea var. sylvestris]|uniref:uncharacterized protein LOC111401904 isoform X1 n=1 Tax=Olea europaea var. sylvestris TaxID=158386 RepID=UPI000C1D3ADF|nr:uncharacterized protein LOC111401904 isoform X1 [Olea europaea var. sylvestris]XP_022885648.1 uncharacterized protein LOC111401904 isoform X2 [Olea europaea var. sylvestris]
MEKLLGSYDREYMKMAMLKHEETFREQVCELHRLYQIQKMLMKETAKNRQNMQDYLINSNKLDDDDYIHTKAMKCLDLEEPAGEFIAESDDSRVLEIEDYNDLELTLGLKSYYTRGKDTETSPESDFGPSINNLSSSIGSNHVKRTRKYAREESLNQQKWGLGMTVSIPSFLGGRKISSEVEEHLRKDGLNAPPWLFQALSLNMS